MTQTAQPCQFDIVSNEKLDRMRVRAEWEIMFCLAEGSRLALRRAAICAEIERRNV